MSRHDERNAIRHMIDHAREAVSLAAGRTPEQIKSDRVVHLALARLFEIVGEAATRVSEETRARHPEVSWVEAIAMRNRLIHGYDSVDLAVVLDAVRLDLPDFIRKLEAVLEKP